MGRTDGRPERPYVMVDRELIELLEPDELALYVVLLSYLRSPERMTDRQCWPSEQELARSYGRSHDAVRRVMNRLIERGLVTKTRRGKTKSNLYQLAERIPGAPASDYAETRNHFRGDYADPRSRDDADPRNEVEEEKEKNYPPGSSMPSLSPSVPRAPAHTEREGITTWAAREYEATAEEIEAAWQYAKENGMGSKTGWFKSCPDDVADQIREVRQMRQMRTEYEHRQKAASQPVPECPGCARPFDRPVPPGTVCRDCAA